MGTLTDASKGPELDADQVLAVPFGDPCLGRRTCTHNRERPGVGTPVDTPGMARFENQDLTAAEFRES